MVVVLPTPVGPIKNTIFMPSVAGLMHSIGKAMEDFKDYDYILVDTAGHSHQNTTQKERVDIGKRIVKRHIRLIDLPDLLKDLCRILPVQFSWIRPAILIRIRPRRRAWGILFILWTARWTERSIWY